MSFHAIVPAGGAGSRLWPLSRKNAPKFLADLTGAGRSLLQQTVDRLEELTPQISVVTGAAHARAVAAQVPQASVIVEPSARGTMGAIGLAAAIIAERDPEAVVGSFAADHLIRDDEAFRDAVRAAVETAGHGYLVTIGIAPEAPSTAYGYIETGGRLSHAAIVAREYGIPAVLGIPGATSTLADGQPVTVDGTQGQVTVPNSESVN